MARDPSTYRANKPPRVRVEKSSTLSRRDLQTFLRFREKGKEWHCEGRAK